MTTIWEFAQSEYEPDRTVTGRTKGAPCIKSIASPSARRSFTSTSTISLANPLIIKA